MVKFKQQGTTVTSQMYCETLKKLRTARHSEKRCGMLTFGVVLHHDNARPHTAARSGALLEHFNWELFDHPPYSPVSFFLLIVATLFHTRNLEFF
jgi:histone-lysine N-methyltransferase SETMAR